MHECEKKGLAKIAIRKRMKGRGLFFERKKRAICKCMKRKKRDANEQRVLRPRDGCDANEERRGLEQLSGGDFDWQTRGRIARKYIACQLLSG